MYPEQYRPGGKLKPRHYMLMTGVAVAGGIVAAVLFLALVGTIIHIIEIAAVVIVIIFLLRWMIRRATS